MDALRMTRLFSNNEKLSEKLLYELNNYKFFTECTFPSIAVICSEEGLKNEISKVYDKAQSDYVIDVFCTAQGNDGLLEKVMNRDAVILYTNALKIAPKALYDLVNELPVASRKMFILLGGWNQLPRETGLIRRKLVQASKEFPKNDVVMVKGIYEGNTVEGLDTLSDAFKAVINTIKNNFREYRYKAEETLYSLHKKSVNAEISEIQRGITAASEKLSGLHDFIYKKQSGFGVVFKNANISLTDVVDELKVKLDGLVPGEFIDSLRENMDKKELDDINRVVEKLKEIMAEKVTQYVQAISESPKTDVNLRIDSHIQECIVEMQYVVTELGRLNFVNGDLLKEFSALCQEVTSLTNLQRKVRDEFRESLENVAARLKGRINSIELNTKKFKYWDAAGKAMDGIETAVEFLDKIGAEANTEDKSDGKNEKKSKNAKDEDEDESEYEDSSEVPAQVKESTRLERKIADAKSNTIEEIVKELIESTKVSVLAYMDSIMQAAKNDIQKQSKYYVDQYFQRIILGINKISDDLTEQKKMLRNIV